MSTDAADGVSAVFSTYNQGDYCEWASLADWYAEQSVYADEEDCLRALDRLLACGFDEWYGADHRIKDREAFISQYVALVRQVFAETDTSDWEDDEAAFLATAAEAAAQPQ